MKRASLSLMALTAVLFALAGAVPAQVQPGIVGTWAGHTFIGDGSRAEFTLIVDKAIEAGNLLKALARQGQTLIEQMQLVAVYEGEPVPPKKKSVSIRIVYRSFEETLKDDFVNRIHTKATERLIREFNAELPG